MTGALGGGPGIGRIASGAPVFASNASSENVNVSAIRTTPLAYVTAPYDGSANGLRHKILPLCSSIATSETSRVGSVSNEASNVGPPGESSVFEIGVEIAIAPKIAGLPFATPTAGVPM